MRVLILGLIASLSLASMSCAGFKAVERGDFKHVFADPKGTMKPTDKQDVITTEAWEVEVSNSVQRQYVPAPGYKAPVLQETPEVSVAVGEIFEFRVDEKDPVELFIDGNLELWWNNRRKTDGWKDGIDVTRAESLLMVRGKKPG